MKIECQSHLTLLRTPPVIGPFLEKVGGACIDVNLAKGYTGINELKH